MVRRSMMIGSIVVALAAGGCGSDGEPAVSPSPSADSRPLCERIGADALRKVVSDFRPDPPGEGDPRACVRPATSTGEFLRITIENPTPGTDEECANLERDGGTWMPAGHLGGIGEFACGNVVTSDDKGVLVTVLSRRGGTHVSISYGRTPGDVTTVREAVIELARTVMQRA